MNHSRRCCSGCGNEGHNRRTCPKLKKNMKEILGISKLEKSMGERKQEKKNYEMCIICMEEICDFVNNKITLPCNHNYHATCGLRWFKDNNSCPTCRQEVGEKRKKIPVLTPDASWTLIHYRIQNEDFHSMLSKILVIMNTPWLSNPYKQQLIWQKNTGFQGELSNRRFNLLIRESNIENLTNEFLKDLWDEMSENTKQSKIQTWLHENLYFNMCIGMENLMRDAYTFQEIGNSIPGDTSMWGDENYPVIMSDETELTTFEEVEEPPDVINDMLSIVTSDLSNVPDDDILSMGDILELNERLDEEPEEILGTTPISNHSRVEFQSPLLNDDYVTRRTSSRRRQMRRRGQLEEELREV
jgi:hypothetical protein|tara:strand:- start:1269 stop:2339 length:1071 start_codon:yes stop_codon:yes gene_type:complete